MLSFVLCDDNKSILDRLTKILESIFLKHNLDANVSFSTSDANSVVEYVRNNDTNVLFLDIDLKSEISGLDLADKIRKFNKDIYIIFTSAHLEYILLAYRCKTFDFIPKPITFERIEQTILRLIEDVKYTNQKKSFIRLNNKNIIINQDSVLFIKKEGMKAIFYTNSRTYEVYNSFNKIEGSLPNNFIRCHKSYIANTNKIDSINTQDNSIIFNCNCDNKCFIGPKYKNKLLEVLNYGNFSEHLDII